MLVLLEEEIVSETSLMQEFFEKKEVGNKTNNCPW